MRSKPNLHNGAAAESRRYLRSAGPFETRTEGDTGHIGGWAIQYNEPSRPLGLIGVIEEFEPGAFSKTLADRSRVVCLWQHDPKQPLASTDAGTLTFRDSDEGLWYDAALDLRSTKDRDAYLAIERRDVVGSSFGFTALKDKDRWEVPEDPNEPVRRYVGEARLFDVSPATFPAYPSSTIGADEGFIRSLADMSDLSIEALTEAAAAGELRSILSVPQAPQEPPPGTPAGSPLLDAAYRRLNLIGRRGAA